MIGPRATVVLSAFLMKNSAPKELVLRYMQHDRAEDLRESDLQLLRSAGEASARAYAPYSKFHVGAALRTKSGSITTGNNQENASYPAGTCAERTALHSAMSQDPATVITEMAIVVPQAAGKSPVAPCGICRQALLEQEVRQGAPIRLLLGWPEGPVIELKDCRGLLPLSFDSSFL